MLMNFMVCATANQGAKMVIIWELTNGLGIVLILARP